MNCYHCNPELLIGLTEEKMLDQTLFCGGEPVCTCDEPDNTDTDRFTDDGNPHGESFFEFVESSPFASWMFV